MSAWHFKMNVLKTHKGDVEGTDYRDIRSISEEKPPDVVVGVKPS